jgi:hypothetical protein
MVIAKPPISGKKWNQKQLSLAAEGCAYKLSDLYSNSSTTTSINDTNSESSDEIEEDTEDEMFQAVETLLALQNGENQVIDTGQQQQQNIVQNRYTMEEAIKVLKEDPMYDLATMNQKHEKKRAKMLKTWQIVMGAYKPIIEKEAHTISKI